MYYLYGSRPGAAKRLVATFDTEGQLLSYVRWATLSERDGLRKFEQGSALVSYSEFSHSAAPLTDDAPEAVDHNPTPSML